MLATLTDAEIVELTKRSHRDAQIKQLQAMGIRFLVRTDDTIVIARAHVDALLGVSSAAAAPKVREPQVRL